MPEGHTIHRLARDQSLSLVGHMLDVSSPQGRFLDEAKILNGKKLVKIEAYGKHLFYRFGQDDDSDLFLHIHLGLFGKYRNHRRVNGEVPQVYGATRVRFMAPAAVVDVNGPNQCELLDLVAMQALVNRLGPDPLRPDAEIEKAWDRIKKSRTSIGKLIIDQSIIAGIGNIYRTELLFRARLDPNLSGCDLSRAQFRKLWKDAVCLLKIGVKYNRIITVDLSKTKKPPSRLNGRERTLVFAKKICPVCSTKIVRFEISKRRASKCDRCQISCNRP